jgi:hypothetical protein
MRSAFARFSASLRQKSAVSFVFFRFAIVFSEEFEDPVELHVNALAGSATWLHWSCRHPQRSLARCAAVQLFHYHLVTSRVREVEARYIGKLAFDLVARHGRIGEDLTSYEPGVSWSELDRMGFKLRLTELEKGAVNVVVQPGQWPTPRVDHLGLVLEDDEFETTLARAEQNDLRVQEHGGRRTFVSTNAGYRLELHPPREWIDELLAQGDDLRLSELHLKADDPSGKAKALAQILDVGRYGNDVKVGETVVRFVRGGPQGRPELFGELFV